MNLTVLRSSRARRGALLVGISLTSAALAGGVAGSAAVASSLPAAAPVSVASCTTLSGARVPAGKSAPDPNDLTRAQAAKAEQRFATQLTDVGLSKHSSLPPITVTIPIRYHVIVRNDGSGAPTKQQLAAQVAVLNKAYAGKTSKYDARTNFQYAVKSVDVTRNSDWYDWSIETDSDDQEAKRALHRGSKRDLNVYVTGLSDGLLGYSTFPFTNEPVWEDGVVVLTDSLPGGSAAPYNEGDTLTHEVGHWLGLYHTFENGCAAPGDEVSDTPAQADGDNIFYCNEADDTCPAPGADPVHNFMSYGDDPCLDRFTNGQAYRMALAYYAFRSGLYFRTH